MSLIIEPSDLLNFKRPLTNVTKEVLLVKNPNAEPVIFKVKTTAPKQYCVRPNAGRIDGNGQVEVQVILQPFKEEPPLDFKCKDKFLVQSALVQSHEYDSIPITDLWTRIETQDKGAIRQHKIKCSFTVTPAQETTTTVNNDTADNSHSTQPLEPDYSNSIHDVSASHETKEHDPSTTTHHYDKVESTSLPEENITTNDPVTIETTKEKAPVIEDTTPRSKVELSPHQHTEAEKEPQTATPVTASPSISKTSSLSLPTEDHPTKPVIINKPVAEVQQEGIDEKQQLRQALEAAQQQITRLQRELEQNKQDLDGLRLRQNASGTESRKLPPNVQPSDAVHQHLAQLQKPHPVEGYPPQVVAIMCGVIFIFTYLFF